ncbi:hypothetical protein D1AOALGA4SA_10102 [Olavius algarvensis Delta 1 endosymbiont]|nr:hypothetical protein D1AOALGA4SA_10102 [Olavius algarvensis Delta 1 endosymbiont]
MEKILSDWCDRSGHTVAFFWVIVPFLFIDQTGRFFDQRQRSYETTMK